MEISLHAKVTESKTMSFAEDTSGAVRPLVEGLGASMTAKKSVAAAAAFVTAMIGPAVWLTENAIIITDISTLESRFELGCK
tara:strand:- start:836 stop:1081 length:246 start_codon:yes stop_codon:yes gene_type:complete